MALLEHSRSEQIPSGLATPPLSPLQTTLCTALGDAKCLIAMVDFLKLVLFRGHSSSKTDGGLLCSIVQLLLQSSALASISVLDIAPALGITPDSPSPGLDENSLLLPRLLIDEALDHFIRASSHQVKREMHLNNTYLAATDRETSLSLL